MGIAEAVKNGFALSGKLMKVVTIFFVFNLIMGLVSLPFANPENAGQPGIALISFLLSLVFFAIFIFLQGGALGMAKDVYKKGVANISDFSAYGKKYYGRILGLLLLYIAIGLVLALLLVLGGSGVLALADNAITRTIITAIAILVVLVTIILFLFPLYSIVTEENSVIQAFKKGVKVGRENFWKVLGLFLVLVFISVIISIIVGFIVGLVTVPMPFTASQILITIANSVVQAYIPIVMMLALMGYYMGLIKQQESSEGLTA